LLAYRYLPLTMAEHAWLFGPLLLLTTASVIHAYVRTTRLWDPKAAAVRLPHPRTEPQPELV
jgi:hypothetical protein